MAKSIMIMGTMSSAGKSFVTAGLCRIFHQDGYKTAPFKSQNMALNSYVTRDHLEMGRAQAMQAEAAGIEPDIRMNPILLKPSSDSGSQVIVNGEIWGTMPARDYYRKKKELIPEILNAYQSLADEYDIIVLEGAGSPAEINLRSVDIVNMGMAELSNSPVILVGDIDRGGVFASLYGTVMLLQPEEKARIRGLIINKFRGDPEILRPGLTMLEELTGIPVLGVLPYQTLDLDDEDSLSDRLNQHQQQNALLDIAVIRFPRISNFTDLNALERIPEVSVRYVTRLNELNHPDLIILPGTKNTVSDLDWIRQNGLEAGILKAHAEGSYLFGICGGYQMLGNQITDPEEGTIRGMQLLNTETYFQSEKRRTRIEGKICQLSGAFSALSDISVNGYEIHMGQTVGTDQLFIRLTDGTVSYCNEKMTVFGTYLHGIFDQPEFTETFLRILSEQKQIYSDFQITDPDLYQQMQYDQLADLLRNHLDMDKIYEILS